MLTKHVGYIPACKLRSNQNGMFLDSNNWMLSSHLKISVFDTDKYLMVNYFILLLMPIALVSIFGCSSKSNTATASSVKDQVAAQIKFYQNPGGGASSEVWSQQPIIEILDSSGTRVTSGPDAWSPISISLSSGTGTLSGTVTVFAVMGLATFTDLKINSAGTKILNVSKSNLSGYGGSDVLSVASEPFNVVALSASQLSISGPGEIDSASCSLFTIHLQDSSGNDVRALNTISLNLVGGLHGSFYSDSGCSARISSVVHSAGESISTFYYLNLGGEKTSLTAQAPSLTLNSLSFAVKVRTPVPAKIFGPKIAGTHRCVLYTNGTAYCWGGINTYGQLGYLNSDNPTPVRLSFPITSISISTYSTCALLTNRTVNCWGGNINGELGIGTFDSTPHSIPVAVSSLSDVNRIISGKLHFCASTNSQGVQCWGSNGLKQLGDGTTTRRTSPVTAAIHLPSMATIVSMAGSGNSNLIAYSDGTVEKWGASLAPASVAGLSTVSKVFSSGEETFCAVLNDSSISCWGRNDTYQLGLGDNAVHSTPTVVTGINNVDELSMFTDATCAKLINGSVSCWGANASGQSGMSSLFSNYVTTPTAIQSGLIVANMSSGESQVCGVENSTQKIVCWGGAVSSQFYYPDYGKLYRYLSNSNNFVGLQSGVCTAVTFNLYNLNTIQEFSQNLNFTITSKNGVVQSYSEATCQTPIQNLTIPANNFSYTIYVKGIWLQSSAGNDYLTLNSAESFFNGATLAVSFSGTATKVFMNTVSAGSPGCFLNTFKILDNVGNFAFAGNSGIDVDINTYVYPGWSGVSIYSDSNCSTLASTITVSPSSSTGNYYLKLDQDCDERFDIYGQIHGNNSSVGSGYFQTGICN